MAPTSASSKWKKPVRKSPARLRVVTSGIRRMNGNRVPDLAKSGEVSTLKEVKQLLNKSNGEPAAAVETKAGSRMKVVVRVRPRNHNEMTVHDREVVAVAGPNMLVFDPKVEEAEFFYHNRKQKDVTATKYKNLNFAFDHVYDKDADTRRIYDDVAGPMLTTLLTGINCTIFAYGATGSGKTFTMLGGGGSNGLTYLVMEDLYTRLQEMQGKFQSKLVVSYFEVYNEQIRDLLNYTNEPLAVRDIGSGIDIANLSYHHPQSAGDLMSMLATGNERRSQHPTDHNKESSRSHAVLQVHVSLTALDAAVQGSARTAKLVMVDLAGSERGSATGYQGARFREGASINKSLLALSNCINALSSGKKRFVQYRDSKLTRILKDSLCGNSRTVMIANISPTQKQYEDTLNTLRYAEKAKKIMCPSTQNVMTVRKCLSEYTTLVNDLTARIKHLEDANSALVASEKEMKEKMSMMKNVVLRYDGNLEALQTEIDKKDNMLLLCRQKLKEAGLRDPTDPNYVPSPKEKSNFLASYKIPKKKQKLEEPGQNSVATPPPNENSSPRGTLRSPLVVSQAINSSNANLLMEFYDKISIFMEAFSVDSPIMGDIEKEVNSCTLDYKMLQTRATHLQELHASTGEERYLKGLKRTNRKIMATMVKLDGVLDNASRLSRTPRGAKSKGNLKLPWFECYREEVDIFLDGIPPDVRRATHKHIFDVAQVYDNLCRYKQRNIGLQHQVSTMTLTFEKHEQQLHDAAKLANKLLNLLKHFKYDTPSIIGEYNAFVSSYLGTTVQFCDEQQAAGQADDVVLLPDDAQPVYNRDVQEPFNFHQFYLNNVLDVLETWEVKNTDEENRLNLIVMKHQRMAAGPHGIQKVKVRPGVSVENRTTENSVNQQVEAGPSNDLNNTFVVEIPPSLDLSALRNVPLENVSEEDVSMNEES